MVLINMLFVTSKTKDFSYNSAVCRKGSYLKHLFLRITMGYAEITLKLPTDYSEKLLEKRISEEISCRNFSFHIIRRSLDARNKRDIHFMTKIGVIADNLSGKEPVTTHLEIPDRRGTEKKVIITGCGPAATLPYSYAILEMLGYCKEADALREGMMYNRLMK